MRDTARKVAKFILWQQGLREPSIELQTDLYVHLYEEMCLQDWKRTTCCTCIHDPTDCPFFPASNTRVRGLHVHTVVYKETSCGAFEARPVPGVPGEETR